MSNDTIPKTLTVAIILCVVCSVLVSATAVSLRPRQEKNAKLYKQRNILKAAGLMEEGKDVDTLFKRIESKVVDLATGEFDETIKAANYDQRSAAKTADLSVVIPTDKDLGNNKRRAKKAPVYLVKEGGKIKTVILPIHGMGLWDKMYGFLALASDGNTVKGITFYEHVETPGLGAEVENPRWQKGWVGKTVFNEDNQLVINIVKGSVDKSNPDAIHQIDGLSGATLTQDGVNNFIRYWLDDHGFGNFLAKMKGGLDG